MIEVPYSLPIVFLRHNDTLTQGPAPLSYDNEVVEGQRHRIRK
jgi:hypothetical protein